MPKFSFKGLRSRLFLLIILAVIPALLLIIYATYMMRKDAETALRYDSLRTVQLAASNAGQVVEGTRQLLISVGTKAVDQKKDPGRFKSYLQNLVKELPYYSNIIVTDTKGNLKFSAIPFSKPVNYADRLWFKRVTKNHTFSVGEYIVGRLTNQKQVVFAYPVTDQSGNIQYIIAAPIDIKMLNKELRKIHIAQDSVFTIVDSHGVILARAPESEKWVGKTLPDAGIIKIILSEHEGTKEGVGVDGVKRLFSFSPISGTNKNMFAAFGVPKETAFALIEKNFKLNLTSLSIIFIFIVTLGWFGSELFVMRRIKALMAASKRFGEGDLSTRVVMKGSRNDEMGNLANAFDQMAEALQQREIDRKQAAEELQKLKNYLSNIIDSMPSILVGTDMNGIITQWNIQAESATGIPAREALGKPITSVITDFSLWIEALQKKVEKQRAAVTKKISLEKHSKRKFYDLMVYPLVTNGVQGTVVRIEDITEQTRIQEMMVQTEKIMSVGGLAAGMAHEINNPLGIIAQAAQNIERRISSDITANVQKAQDLGINFSALHAYMQERQITEFVSNIRNATERAAKIISDMLQFSRKSSGIMKPTSLSELIDQTVNLVSSDYDLKKKYDFKNINIMREYEPDIPEVPVISVEIQQVILNLLKNSVQAMANNPPERKPIITLCLKREEKYAVIEVKDNGPGMEENVRRMVFEPFFTTKKEGIGTGLGLSVSFMIITGNHKGLISVESSPDNGACFTIKLPLQQEG